MKRLLQSSAGRSSVRRWLCFASEVSRGSHDCDAAERIQIEEILVTGHDHVCTPVYGRLKELVILRIARCANRLQHIDDFDERCDALEQRVAPFPVHVAIELRRMQPFDQFRLVSMTTRSRVIVGEQLVQAFFGEAIRGSFGRNLVPEI
jgi:hypothetical protein